MPRTPCRYRHGPLKATIVDEYGRRLSTHALRQLAASPEHASSLVSVHFDTGGFRGASVSVTAAEAAALYRTNGDRAAVEAKLGRPVSRTDAVAYRFAEACGEDARNHYRRISQRLSQTGRWDDSAARGLAATCAATTTRAAASRTPTRVWYETDAAIEGLLAGQLRYHGVHPLGALYDTSHLAGAFMSSPHSELRAAAVIHPHIAPRLVRAAASDPDPDVRDALLDRPIRRLSDLRDT